jgi:hypothetical protein
MKHILAVAILGLALTSQAFAIGSVTGAHVTQVRVDADGRGMVFFDQNLAGAMAACGQDSAYKNAMAFNPSTGKGLLAVALAAKAAGTTIDAYGSGACGVYGDYVEDFSYAVNH